MTIGTTVGNAATVVATTKAIAMSANIWFDMVLDKMQEVSDSKRHDYASEDDPFLNFIQVADISGLTTDQVFLVWVTTKMVRLGQLIGGDKAPNNESVDDNIIDLANYAALWAGLRLRESQAQMPAVANVLREAWHDLTKASRIASNA